MTAFFENPWPWYVAGLFDWSVKEKITALDFMCFLLFPQTSIHAKNGIQRTEAYNTG
jgi:hypothetical protein